MHKLKTFATLIRKQLLILEHALLVLRINTLKFGEKHLNGRSSTVMFFPRQ